MSPEQQKRASKFLSLVLRHRPEVVGIELGPQGWVDIDVLLTALDAHGRRLTRRELDAIVRTNSKKRFLVSADGLRIRASQGHSVNLDLGYEPVEPPALLFHGTAERFLEAIRREGLRKMQRHHVHLSASEATAREVGARHGRPVVLRVDAKTMHERGAQFFCSDNGVWLTDAVAPEFLAGWRDPRAGDTGVPGSAHGDDL
ncbi:MAG: RNA 2'-phosphotransferase [Deltaproteobacteria bacterium]